MEQALVGNLAPDFSLTSNRGSNWRLSDHLGKVTVLLFYPQNETFVCNRQLCSVRDNWSKYLETKAEIVGVSPATADEHETFANKYNLPLDLLADVGRSVTSIFAKHSFFPLSLTRGVVVIGADGIVRSRDLMLRAFRPPDNKVIRQIYAARSEALNQQFDSLLMATRDALKDDDLM